MPALKIAACYCTFKRDTTDEWEPGLAITTEHGLYEVVAIFPADATTRVDALSDVYDYNLDWTRSLYPAA